MTSKGAAPIKLNKVSAQTGLVITGKKGHLFEGKNGQFGRATARLLPSEDSHRS